MRSEDHEELYAFQTAWLAALRRAKIEAFRFHDLRHTFASWLVQRGRSLKEVQALTMTLRYSHLAPEHLRAAVAVLDDVLSARAELGQKSQRVSERPQTRITRCRFSGKMVAPGDSEGRYTVPFTAEVAVA